MIEKQSRWDGDFDRCISTVQVPTVAECSCDGFLIDAAEMLLAELKLSCCRDSRLGCTLLKVRNTPRPEEMVVSTCCLNRIKTFEERLSSLLMVMKFPAVCWIFLDPSGVKVLLWAVGI